MKQFGNLSGARKVPLAKLNFRYRAGGMLLSDDHHFSSTGTGGSDRVLLQWENQQIANRWLRIGLTVGPFSATFYVGHLLGETTDAVEGTYTVTFEDISTIRSEVGQTVDAGNAADIDKSGTVSFSDISAMRGNVGSQLTNISIP